MQASQTLTFSWTKPTRVDWNRLQAAAQHCIASGLQTQHGLIANLVQQRFPEKVGKSRAGI